MRLLKLKAVLAATDLDPSSDPAVVTAARLAEAAGAVLHVAHVITSERTNTGDSASSPESPSQMEMNATLHRAGLSGKNPNVHIESGAPAKALSSLSDRIRADVIVIGRHRPRGQQKTDRDIGGTAHSIITNSLVPCLVTSQQLQLPIRRALVAIDTSETARGALIVALSWSSALRDAKGDSDPELTALHVETGRNLSSRDAHMRRTIDHELDILRRSAGSWAGVSVEGATETDDDPVAAITRYAAEHQAELVVLGTRGLSADRALRLGSVSAAVTKRSRMPVLLVPPAVWRDYARDIDYF